VTAIDPGLAKTLSGLLLDQLRSEGEVTERWAEAMRAVPRHLFIPELIYRHDQERASANDLIPLHRDTEPDEWLTIAYANAPVNTQVDDGNPLPDGTGREVTSSASQPSVVTGMLAELQIEPGMRVLEIGTGTGWNAALLASVVGAESVTSVEIDPQVAEHARNALAATGYGKVCVITGDGAEGWPDGAPYDRVIATAGALTIPYPWVDQARLGGRLIAPLNNTYHPTGLARLTIGPDCVASGTLGAPLTFMGLRAQRSTRPSVDTSGDADSITTIDVHPYRWAGDRNAALAIGLRVGDGIHFHYSPSTEDTGIAWLLDPSTGSWATVNTTEGRPYEVEQAGSRRLVDEVLDGYRWWLEQGEPNAESWQVTVGPKGQCVALSS
jgi:protein-L-isoaspartate(D-aspartate) O-methyltransferase